jgi:glucose-6-phosphate dehydrogenase assembly protein OpcA
MSTLSEDRVSTRRWAAENVDVKTVAAEMSRLHTELTHEDMGDDEHPRPRNCVMNLVIAVSDDQREEAAEKVVGAVAAGHPLRAIVLHSSAGEKAGLDAEITAEAHQLVWGTSVQLEQLTLKVRGDASEHIASLLEPLLIPDVPTYVWWTGTPPLGERGLRDALVVCDVLIVDSSHFSNKVDAFLDLAALADRLGGRMGFVDLQWARQKAWRETLAQFFAPEERRHLLSGLQRVDIACVGEGRANRVSGTLIGGWLMSLLGWRLTPAVSVSSSGSEAILKGENGQTVQLTLRSATSHDMHHGMLCAVRFDGHSEGNPFAMQMEVRADRSDHAHVLIDMGGEETLHQRLPLPDLDDAALLLQALSSARRDRVYLRSLEAAAKLVDAFR